MSIWDPIQLRYGAISFAGPGDRTEILINRISKGLLHNLTANPLACLIKMVGQSNLYAGDSPSAAVNGVKAVVSLVKKELPKSELVLIGLLPRKDEAPPAKYAQVNAQLLSLYNPADFSTHRVNFVDYSPKFLNSGYQDISGVAACCLCLCDI